MAGEANLTEIAIRSGIHDHIQPSPRQKTRPLPKSVCSKAVRALVGACWIDSSRDLGAVKMVLGRLASFGESRAFSNLETASTHSDQLVTCIDPRALDIPVLVQTPFLSINNSIECTKDVALGSLAINNNWENELQDIRLAAPSCNASDWHILSLVENSEQAMSHVGLTISSEEPARGMPADESSVDNVLFPSVLWPGPQLFPNDNDINSCIDRGFLSAETALCVTSFDSIASTYTSSESFAATSARRGLLSLTICLGPDDEGRSQEVQLDNSRRLQSLTSLADNSLITGRNASAISKNMPRRASKTRLSKRVRPGTHLDDTRIKSYIESEMQKRLRYNSAAFQDRLLDLASLDASIKNLGLTDCADYVRVLLYTPLSCASILFLQSILAAFRETAVGRIRMHSISLSSSERYAEIERLEGDIAYCGLLRRCHVLRLYKEVLSGRPATSAGSFIVNTQESVGRPVHTRFGNPVNCRKAVETEALLKKLVPDVENKGHEVKKSHRQRISRLRVLGSRLHMLTETFGIGLIALLPTNSDAANRGCFFSISDDL